jgi:hypothetical protein
MRPAILAVFLVLASGCVWSIDWAGPWFGCPKGQVKKPPTYGMFGTVKAPARCVDETETKEKLKT